MSRIVLVTGATGGIGSAISAQFSGAGWEVLSTDRQARAPVDRDFMAADIGHPEDLDELFSWVRGRTDHLDALVNNAAVLLTKPLLATRPDEWDVVMSTNVRAAYLSMRLAYPLLEVAQGSVVNVASVHAVSTSSGVAAYAASKGALVALTRAAAIEWAPSGVRVNAVAPGAVDTPMLATGLSRGSPTESGLSAIERLAQRHPLGRVGRPDEVAAAVYYLAAAETASFVTGTCLTVDGGALAQLSTE